MLFRTDAEKVFAKYTLLAVVAVAVAFAFRVLGF